MLQTCDCATKIHSIICQQENRLVGQVNREKTCERDLLEGRPCDCQSMDTVRISNCWEILMEDIHELLLNSKTRRIEFKFLRSLRWWVRFCASATSAPKYCKASISMPPSRFAFLRTAGLRRLCLAATVSPVGDSSSCSSFRAEPGRSSSVNEMPSSCTRTLNAEGGMKHQVQGKLEADDVLAVNCIVTLSISLEQQASHVKLLQTTLEIRCQFYSLAPSALWTLSNSPSN
eukprot:284814691_2